MRDEDRPAVSSPGDFSKERIARFTRRPFNRHLLFLSKRADVCRTEFKFNAGVSCMLGASLARPPAWQAPLPVATFDQFLDKPCIGIARATAQPMIQMANDKPVVTQAD